MLSLPEAFEVFKVQRERKWWEPSTHNALHRLRERERDLTKKERKKGKKKSLV